MSIEDDVQRLMQSPVEANAAVILARVSGQESVTDSQVLELAMAQIEGLRTAVLHVARLLDSWASDGGPNATPADEHE